MAPYPPIERWIVPLKACEQTRLALLPAGRCGCESGVFWLGERASTSSVAAVVKPIGSGVVESPWQWSVAPEVYAAVTAWAKPRGLTLLAAVHSHLSTRRPRMSPTDRSQGLKVPDALAVIVPTGGDELDTTRWGWFVYESDDYRTLEEKELAARVRLTARGCEYEEISKEGSR